MTLTLLFLILFASLSLAAALVVLAGLVAAARADRCEPSYPGAVSPIEPPIVPPPEQCAPAIPATREFST